MAETIVLDADWFFLFLECNNETLYLLISP